MNRTPKKFLYLAAVTAVVACALLWMGRGRIAERLIRRQMDAVAMKYGLEMDCRDIRASGWRGLCLEGITVVPSGADTFLTAGRVRIGLDWRKALGGKIALKEIEATDLSVRFLKEGSTSNFDFLYRPSGKVDELRPDNAGVGHPGAGVASGHSVARPADRSTATSYARRADRSLSLLFRLLPHEAVLDRLRVVYRSEQDTLTLCLPSLRLHDNRFHTEIISRENNVSSKWICRGKRNDRTREIAASLYAAGGSKITFPFLAYRFGAALRFDTLSFALQAPPFRQGVQSLEGRALVKGLTLHHPRLSADTILLDDGKVDYHIRLGKDFAVLDSSTTVTFGRLDFHPYLNVRKAAGDTAWQVEAAVDKRDFPADALFSSLPRGLFANLDGLQTAGTLSYRFRLAIDFARVDSLVFESSLQAKNFRILSYGETDLRKMNEPFLYTVYENGEPVRSFEVGESNPQFRRFAEIARWLPLAILQSEDAGFFHHGGFIPSAIRESLVQDLKERRFARGGSTLSMQLVKNVFLNRRKTMARKLEEILIVWLIEGQRLTSKERMFEVYLNIIEWGPGIYGAVEAAHFYFGKEPSALTLSESIFLASIIPMPKQVRYWFDGLRLKPHADDYFRLITARLVDRGLIAPEEAEGVSPAAVHITGPAREYLAGERKKEDNPIDRASD